jgi:hypothetical protein
MRPPNQDSEDQQPKLLFQGNELGPSLIQPSWDCTPDDRFAGLLLSGSGVCFLIVTRNTNSYDFGLLLARNAEDPTTYIRVGHAMPMMGFDYHSIPKNYVVREPTSV